MRKTRLEAFSDGVIAILITIMVLELRPPTGHTLQDLEPLLPVVSSYVLSFVFIGIYWNNHHHMFHTLHHVTGKVMWANHHLLFWLSVTPFVTAWMGQTNYAPQPVALYGVVLLMTSIAYFLLSRAIIAADGADSILAKAIGRDVKGLTSTAIYLCAIPLAYVSTALACALYIAVAIWWMVPDRRISRHIPAE